MRKLDAHKKTAIVIRSTPWIAILAVSILLFGHDSSEAAGPNRRGAEIAVKMKRMGTESATVHWSLKRITGRKSLQIVAVTGACRGGSVPPPRAKTQSRPGRAIVTVVWTPIVGSTPKRCPRMARKWTFTIHLSTLLTETRVFDGSFTPPRLRYRP